MKAATARPDPGAPSPAAALPSGSSVVAKVGGSTLDDPAAVERVAEGVAALHEAGARAVLVHGGGPQVTAALEEAGLETPFQDGQRVTPPEALAAAEPVLAGLGKELAGVLTAHGVSALALSGRDDHLLRAEPRDGLGRVGRVTSVGTPLLRLLAFNGVVPVVGPPATGPDGDPLNVNADQVAAAVAGALGAAALVLLTDVPGVRDAGGLVEHVTPAGLADLRDRAARGGMVPKLHAAQAALEDGVGRVIVGSAQAPLPDLLAGDAPATVAQPQPEEGDP